MNTQGGVQARFSLLNLRTVCFFKVKEGVKPLVVLPFYLSSVMCGFPSPATDYEENELNIGDYLAPHPHATFIVRASGTSMQGGEAQISPGDLLVVDCSRQPVNNQVVLAVLDGEFTVKRFKRTHSGAIYLVADNPEFGPAIEIRATTQFEVRGVITHVIHQV